MPQLSNYPPGVSGNEPQIVGSDREGPDAPGFILNCCGCGEEFDTLQAAADHIMEGMSGPPGFGVCDEETTFQILPEEMGQDQEELMEQGGRWAAGSDDDARS